MSRTLLNRKVDLLCRILECGRPRLAKQLCGTHYKRQREGRPLEAPIVSKQTVPSSECVVEGCEDPQRARGYCRLHHARLWRGTTPMDAPRKTQPGEWGKWYLTHNGYVQRQRRLNNPEGGRGVKERQYQHQVVIENFLGRSLRPKENVHHKNGNRSDNRLSNLELWSTKQPPGQRVEDKLQWAREMFELYSEPGEVWVRSNHIETATQ